TDAKRKQIELLKEQKQVMINEELKIKNEELKEKLTIKFKKVFRLEYGKSLSDTQRSINGKYPVYGANGIIDRTDYYYIDKPSLIIGRKGSAGAIQKCVEYFWPLDVTYYTVFDENKYDIDYLFYLLLTLNLPDLSKGIKPGLNRNDVYEIEVVIPSLAEQQKIVAYLDNITAKIDLSIAKIEREILLLGEYRTRLISDVVTGKVDIRNLAIQENKADSQLAKTIKLTPKHSKGYDDAVILTALVNSFGTDEHPFTAFDCQKFPYLLHRHIEGIAEKYGKFAAGPYNPILKYRTARPIALKKKYIREHTGGYKGFVADVNAQEAVKYFMEWYGDEPLEWMERFRYIPNRKNELELLTTVDMAMVELTEAKKTVALQEVKEIIKTSPAWKDKLTRPIFSDENIMRAINWSYKLFGNPKDVKNKD
ncbi:MAG: restriction endonuclease subunit S, partial [Tannerella sp.]|nr:restriction endonuclease subunit S [Tannerella sp.]